VGALGIQSSKDTLKVNIIEAVGNVPTVAIKGNQNNKLKRKEVMI
jgi:hypothetical protein